MFFWGGQKGAARKTVCLALLVGWNLALFAGCGKNPKKSDPKPQSKWVILNEGREINVEKIFFVDSLNGWALNEYGGFTNAYWRTRDGGRTWDPGDVPSSPHGGYHLNLAFTDTLTGWIVGTEGVIYHTTDGGESWAVDDRLYEQPAYPKIKKIFFHDSLHGWIGYDAAGARKIARTADGGANWEIVSESGRRLLQALNKDVAFAEESWCADFSRTTDGGATWQVIYPGIESQAAGVLVSFITESEGWATIEWEGGWDTEFFSGSFLIHTINGGASWDTLLTFDGPQMRTIYILPSREGWIFSFSPEAFLYTTDGVTWQKDPLPDVGGRVFYHLFVLPGPHAWITAGGLILKRE